MNEIRTHNYQWIQIKHLTSSSGLIYWISKHPSDTWDAQTMSSSETTALFHIIFEVNPCLYVLPAKHKKYRYQIQKNWTSEKIWLSMSDHIDKRRWILWIIEDLARGRNGLKHEDIVTCIRFPTVWNAIDIRRVPCHPTAGCKALASAGVKWKLMKKVEHLLEMTYKWSEKLDLKKTHVDFQHSQHLGTYFFDSWFIVLSVSCCVFLIG